MSDFRHGVRLLLGLVCLSPQLLFAEPQPLDEAWYYFHGSPAQCQHAERYRDAWLPVDLNKNNRYGSEDGMVACFVNQFNWRSAGREQSLYIHAIRHSDISWINEVEIGRLGKLNTPWRFEGTKPQNLHRLYPVQSALLSDTKNTLSIATTMGFSRSRFAMFPGGSGLLSPRVLLGPTQELRAIQQQSMANTLIIDSIIATLSLVDIALIALLYWLALITVIEFPAVAAGSVFMSLGVFGTDLPFLQIPNFAFGEVLYMLGTLIAPPV